jgi:hypothetical protein
MFRRISHNFPSNRIKRLLARALQRVACGDVPRTTRGVAIEPLPWVSQAAALLENQELKALSVSVETYKGQVLLSGW